MNIVEHRKCRVCGQGNLNPILSLGDQFSVGFPDSAEQETVKAPLDLVLCDPRQGGCGLLQLKHTLDHDVLYREYWYKSGISTTMVKALGDIVRSGEKLMALKPGDLVIDIGANDGTLLRQYTTQGVEKVGFEPSNLWKLGVEAGTRIINDYFNHASFARELGDRRARMITSIAMFYDLEDPNAFVRDIKLCLDKDGLWIVQMNYLGLMLKENTFDNISHEHLEYYSLFSVENLLRRHGMEVMDVELNDVNGGSYRLYIRNVGAKIEGLPGGASRLISLRDAEKDQGFDSSRVYQEFSSRIQSMRDQLLEVLRREASLGRRIYIYGASTRGLVVLQYAGINSQLIPFAVDKNSDKWGRYIVGTGIKVIPFEEYRATPPDCLLVLPYQFKNEIAWQEREFLNNGGRMIFAMPTVHVIDREFLDEKQEKAI
jgi:NDP-4-keto-2,6-dideoxyhexose 3-C-methyltransferase